MSREFCDTEPLVIAAARSGAWTSALEEHRAECAGCAEAKRVALLFLGQTTSEPLPASLVWQRLQARRRQQAIRRATRCMTGMCALAVIYAIVLAAWYLPQLWHAQLATDLSSLSGGFAIAGVLAAILAVLIGSCCFAYLGSRTDFRLRS
jgi:small-conductance mechanosensitive channel